MFELRNTVSKTDRLLPAASPSRGFEERKQRRMMIIALTLLLVALGFVLYRDRDFWFPETQEAEEQPQAQPQQSPAGANPTTAQVNFVAISHSPGPRQGIPIPLIRPKCR